MVEALETSGKDGSNYAFGPGEFFKLKNINLSSEGSMSIDFDVKLVSSTEAKLAFFPGQLKRLSLPEIIQFRIMGTQSLSLKQALDQGR